MNIVDDQGDESNTSGPESALADAARPEVSLDVVPLTAARGSRVVAFVPDATRTDAARALALGPAVA